MSDENQTPTEEELSTLKLVVEFQKAAQAEVEAIQNQFQTLFTQKTEEVKNTMSDEDLDSAVAAKLVTPAMTREQAEEQLAQIPPQMLPMVLPQLGIDPGTLDKNADIKEVVIAAIMEQNPGVDEAKAKEIAHDDMSRNQKRGMLAEEFAMQAMGGHPQEMAQQAQQEIMGKMGIDPQDVNAKMQAMAQKYGPEVVQQEMQKLAGPTMH